MTKVLRGIDKELSPKIQEEDKILMEWAGGDLFERKVTKMLTKEPVEGRRSEAYLDISYRSMYGQFYIYVLGNGFQSSKVVLVAINWVLFTPAGWKLAVT